MDGSRGATGSVDVGVSHLNMNINVIGGGHGLGSGGLTSGGDKGTGAGDSVSSSTPVSAAVAAGGAAIIASSSSNGGGGGGLPSGRSRSPGFDVDKPTSSPQPSSGDNAAVSGAAAAAAAAAAAFLDGATVVTGAPGGGSEGGGWLGSTGAAGATDFSTAALGRKDGGSVDHAFAGAMLQRSTSAPPVSDHVRPDGQPC
ncbi:unnamed protein product [Hapterophycus canaliculatus]